VLPERDAITGAIENAITSRDSQAPLGVPVHVRRLSDRAIVVSLGDFAWSNQTVAIASRKGLVVVDTQASRSAGKLVRDAIEKAFGRTDFAYVINTHQHYDHTTGNQLYPGVPVVGHDQCAVGMRQDVAGKAESLARAKAAILGFQDTLKTLDPQSVQAKTNREYIALMGATVDEAETGFVLTPPTVTFSDAMTLDLGDVTVHLRSLPAGHTPGDIVVHVPEEGLLCAGDMIAEGWLPVLDARSTPEPDDLLPKWRRLLADAAGTKHVVMGHGFSTIPDGPDFSRLSIATLTWRYTYLQSLWSGLARARASGRTLDEAKAEFAVERAFPDLKDKRRDIRGRDGAAADAHVQNIDVLWRALERRPG
jgi:glyoxylase-like metal-dependent hydrolase (beta-lactamase superfamily II)